MPPKKSKSSSISPQATADSPNNIPAQPIPAITQRQTRSKKPSSNPNAPLNPSNTTSLLPNPPVVLSDAGRAISTVRVEHAAGADNVPHVPQPSHAPDVAVPSEPATKHAVQPRTRKAPNTAQDVSKSRSRRSTQQVQADKAAEKAHHLALAHQMEAQRREIEALKAALRIDARKREAEAETEVEVLEELEELEEPEAGDQANGFEEEQVEADIHEQLARVEAMELSDDSVEAPVNGKTKGTKKGSKKNNGKPNVARSRAAKLADGLTDNFRKALTGTKKSASKTQTPPVIGGLHDSDIEDRGIPGKTKVVQNNTLVVDLNSDGESPSPAAPAPPNPSADVSKPIPNPRISKSATPIPAESRSHTPATSRSQTPDSSASGNKPRRQRAPGAKKDTTLPSFVDKKVYDSSILPTFRHKILVSHTPMSFKRDQNLVPIVKEALDLVYPENQHRVSLHGDPLFDRLYGRMGNMQNRIGQQAVTVIKQFFDRDPQYQDSATRLEFARWAIRADGGPMIYGRPSPNGILKGQPGYVKPGDIFNTPFIISMMRFIMTGLVKGTRGVHFGRPVGALGMAATALKRAFKAYIINNGDTPLKVTSQFSEGIWGTDLIKIMSLVNQITPHQWDKLMDQFMVEELIEGHDGVDPDAQEDEYVVPSDVE
ncbi:hypothetical protein VNI00_014285 [Paramarasmius palmivorus]|uniref:Uncharacterized protein n=1 Tax=Paramarasmius palmivorus TaxID=297713 RepID=A0AAW0BUC5_9AGAR